jgi:hypothetical protein
MKSYFFEEDWMRRGGKQTCGFRITDSRYKNECITAKVQEKLGKVKCQTIPNGLHFQCSMLVPFDMLIELSEELCATIYVC